MIILINASDIKAGGGIQVADSVCCELNKYPQHCFIAVLSSYMKKTAERTACYANVEVIKYDCPKYNVRLLQTGRDVFMDRLVWGAICELIANGEEQIISTTCCRTLAFEGRRMAA